MLNAEIMARYGLAKDWRTAGFFETENHRRITHAVRSGLGSGRLVAITGPVGIGKTVFLHRMQDEIFSVAFNYEGDAIISGSKDNTCRIWRA